MGIHDSKDTEKLQEIKDGADDMEANFLSARDDVESSHRDTLKIRLVKERVDRTLRNNKIVMYVIAIALGF